MKKLALALALALVSVTAASAQYQPQPYGGFGTGSNPNSHYVSPYTTRSGTYVAPHYQTNPNGTQYDNFGTRGNLNPYTG